MLTLKNPSKGEPGLILAGILAVLVHVVFIVFMVFGLNWKSHPPESMAVELWHELSEPVEPLPTQKTEPPKPEPVKSEPTPPKPVEADPSPNIDVTPPPPPSRKPDIVRKQEEPIKDDKKEQEKKRQQEEAKQREKAKAEQLRREQAERQRKREAKEKREAQEAAARAQQMSEVAKYKAMILAKIKSRIIMPPDLPGNPNVEYLVTLLPGGDILDVRLSKSSGFAGYDDAVERAIFLSKPLPLPPDPGLFSQFRNLSITVHYHE